MKIDVKSVSPQLKRIRFPHRGQGEAKALAQKPIKGMYAEAPAVPSGKVAAAPLVPSDPITKGVPKLVPHEFGSFEGPAENFPHQQPRGAVLGAGGHPPIKTPHGFGHSAVQRIGKMRISGNPASHRIGKK